METEPLPKNYHSIFNLLNMFKGQEPKHIAHIIIVCYWLYNLKWKLYVPLDDNGVFSTEILKNSMQVLKDAEKYLIRARRVRPEKAPSDKSELLGEYKKPESLTNIDAILPDIPSLRLVNCTIEQIINIGKQNEDISCFEKLWIGSISEIALDLIHSGRPDLAESVLLTVNLNASDLPDSRERTPWNPYGPVYRYSRVWACLGNEKKAWEIVGLIPLAERNSYSESWLRNVIVVNDFYRTKNSARILERFNELIKEKESPKDRVSDFRTLLKVLLYENASVIDVHYALNIIQETLVGSNWDFKYRLRLLDLLETLWPYRTLYSDEIYRFSADLLIQEALLGMTYRIEPGSGIVTMECLRWFIWYWADGEGIAQALQMARAWRKEINRL